VTFPGMAPTAHEIIREGKTPRQFNLPEEVDDDA
jgi:hypothetical protein